MGDDTAGNRGLTSGNEVGDDEGMDDDDVLSVNPLPTDVDNDNDDGAPPFISADDVDDGNTTGDDCTLLLPLPFGMGTFMGTDDGIVNAGDPNVSVLNDPGSVYCWCAADDVR